MLPVLLSEILENILLKGKKQLVKILQVMFNDKEHHIVLFYSMVLRYLNNCYSTFKYNEKLSIVYLQMH